MLHTIFTHLFMLFVILATAQTGQISGKLVNSENEPLAFSNVLLKHIKDSTLYKGEVSNEQGEFAFTHLKNGNYFIQIVSSIQKYDPINNLIISDSLLNYSLGVIQLKKQANELETVTVKAEKQFIEKQTDKTVVNIENSIIQTGSSVMEVIEKLPGVLVDSDGNIKLRGKQGVVILLDGKQMVLSGQDLANLLKGMPSNTIQKIEIITNPSAKWDAAGNAGILNIITKRNKKEGWNAGINLSYGQGRYAKINPSINFSYKRNWFNFFVNYGYSNRKGFNNLILNRKFYENDTLKSNFITYNYIVFPFQTHSPRMGMDFYISKKTTLSFVTGANSNHFNPGAFNYTDILDENKKLSSAYEFHNQSKDKFYNTTLSSQLKHKIDTMGQEISIDLDYGKYWNTTNQLFTTYYFDGARNLTSTNYLVSKQLGALQLYSIKADYSKAFKNNLSIESGVKSSLVKSDKDMQFYNKVNDIDAYDSARSSHFLYNENINAAYISIKKQLNKLSMQVGLRAEHTLADGKQVINDTKFHRNYVQFFPTLYLDYKLSEKNQVNINVGKRIDRPHYEQMNPFRRLIDATTYSEGNPYLLPQITYHTEAGYAYNNLLFFTASYDYTYNNITDVLIQDSKTRTTIQSVVNINKLNFFSFDVNFSKKINSWWRTNSNIQTYYGIYSGVVNNYTINQGTPSFNVNSQHIFTFKEGFSGECQIQYNHRNLYGVTLMKTTYNVTIGIQKSIFKNKGTLTLNCSDIFWRAYPSGITDFGNVNEEWKAIRDTRVVTAAFSYKIGNGQAGKMRRNTGADDEKNRIN